jgi:hypothetical protein
MQARWYQRVIVCMNGGSVLWWALDFMNPMWGWRDALIPVYLAAMALFFATPPLWLFARWHLRARVGRAAGLAIAVGLLVNVFGVLRALGAATRAFM